MKDRNLKRMVGEFPILCGKAKRACSIMAGFGWDNRDLRDERDRDERDFRDNREGVACRGLG